MPETTSSAYFSSREKYFLLTFLLIERQGSQKFRNERLDARTGSMQLNCTAIDPAAPYGLGIDHSVTPQADLWARSEMLLAAS